MPAITKPVSSVAISSLSPKRADHIVVVIEPGVTAKRRPEFVDLGGSRNIPDTIPLGRWRSSGLYFMSAVCNANWE
jgi:hypothetical protein